MIQRRAIIGVVLLAAIPALTGCGLEVKDETQREQSPVQATDVSVGAIDIRDAFITYDTASTAPPTEETPIPLASPTGATTSGYLVVTLVNNGVRTDSFTGVTSPLGPISASGGGTAVQLPPGIPVAFGAPQLGGTGPTLQISSATPATEGTNVLVTFSFANAGSRTVPVPVVESDDTSTLPFQAIPTPTATQTLGSEGLQPASD